MPLHVWRDRDFSLLMMILVLGFVAFAPSTFWLSLYMQRVQHLSALIVALHLLPMALMGILVNVVAGLLLHRVSNKLLVFIGAVSYTIALTLLAVQKEDSSYWAFIFPSLFFLVIGADLQFNVVNMYSMASLPIHQQSVAGGIFNTVTKLCITVGLGISTSIYTSVSTTISSEDSPLKPYTAVYWFCFAASAFSICLVPFLRIGTQGGKSKEKSTEETVETAGDVGTEPGLAAMAEKNGANARELP